MSSQDSGVAETELCRFSRCGAINQIDHSYAAVEARKLEYDRSPTPKPTSITPRPIFQLFGAYCKITLRMHTDIRIMGRGVATQMAAAGVGLALPGLHMKHYCIYKYYLFIYLSIYVYVHVCVCMYVCKYIHKYTHMYT